MAVTQVNMGRKDHSVIQVNADKDIVIHDPHHQVKVPQAMDATSHQAPESLAMYTQKKWVGNKDEID